MNLSLEFIKGVALGTGATAIVALVICLRLVRRLTSLRTESASWHQMFRTMNDILLLHLKGYLPPPRWGETQDKLTEFNSCDPDYWKGGTAEVDAIAHRVNTSR